MMDTFICQKCGDECVVDGEYPKFIIWCDTCNDYAKGEESYAVDYKSDLIDQTYDRLREIK